MNLEELRNRFDYHPPRNEDDKQFHAWVRHTLYRAAEALVEELPDCRETSLVITKLEEAMFWGNAAIARNRDA